MDSGLLSKRIPIKKKANPLTDLISAPKKDKDRISEREEEIKTQNTELKTPQKNQKSKDSEASSKKSFSCSF